MAVALIAAAAAVVLWRATSALETSTVRLVIRPGAGAREEAAAKKGGRTKVAEVEVVEAAISPVDVAPDVTPDAPQAKA